MSGPPPCQLRTGLFRTRRSYLLPCSFPCPTSALHVSGRGLSSHQGRRPSVGGVRGGSGVGGSGRTRVSSVCLVRPETPPGSPERRPYPLRRSPANRPTQILDRRPACSILVRPIGVPPRPLPGTHVQHTPVPRVGTGTYPCACQYTCRCPVR